MPVKDIYPTRRLSTSINLSLDLDRISSHYVGQSQRSNLIHNDTIKEGDEREPLLYKPDGLGNFVYSTIDTMTLSLVPHIQVRDQEHPGISWLSVAFGIANAAIGVGVLNYPAAYHKIGGIEIATIVQLALVTILFISMSILIFCSDLNGSNSYHEILSNICGKKAEILVAGDIFLGTFGICVAYLIVIGDQYDRILASLVGDDFCHYWFLNRKFTIAATAIFISPLCFMKKLDFLRHTGPLGIISMAYVVFLTIYEHYALTDVVPGEIRTRPESFTVMFGIIPVMCFGYQCNEVIIPIYASMKDRSPKNFYKAASLAYGVLIFLYGAIGYFGYRTFGSKVYPDIITMFNARDPLVMIGITALILKMAVTYPQMCFVGRGAFEGVFAYFSGKNLHDLEKTEQCRRNTISCTWFIGSLLLALFAPDIGVVIEALGSLAAVNIFIFPSMCLILLAYRDRYGFSRITKFIFYTIGIVFIVIGVIVLSLVLNQVYIDLSGTNSEPLVPLCRA